MNIHLVKLKTYNNWIYKLDQTTKSHLQIRIRIRIQMYRQPQTHQAHPHRLAFAFKLLEILAKIFRQNICIFGNFQIKHAPHNSPKKTPTIILCKISNLINCGLRSVCCYCFKYMYVCMHLCNCVCVGVGVGVS